MKRKLSTILAIMLSICLTVQPVAADPGPEDPETTITAEEAVLSEEDSQADAVEEEIAQPDDPEAEETEQEEEAEAVSEEIVLPVNNATFEDINQNDIFVNQATNYTCTLASAVMMVRRAALLNGDTNWRAITESAMRSTAWSEGNGLYFNFTYAGIKVSHANFSGSDTNYVISLLDNHPEGIVVYDYNKPHAILLTDYTNGTFYCSDPGISKKYRMPISEASITLESADAFWYVSSPSCSINTAPPANITITQSQYWYDDQDTVTITAHADNATRYIVVIDDAWGLRLVDEHMVGTSYSFPATRYIHNNYYACVIAENSKGGIQSEWIEIPLVGPAGYTEVNTSKEHYDLNDEVDLYVSTVCAKGAVVGIDKCVNGEWIRFVTEETNDFHYRASASALGEGEYTAYFSVYNGSGGVDTERIAFKIGTEEESVRSLNILTQPTDSTASVGSTATFHITAENAASYQWQYSLGGSNWYNSTAATAKKDTLNVTVSKSNYQRRYRCKVTGEDGEVLLSESAHINLIPWVNVIQQPESPAMIKGETVNFYVEAENVAAGGYQWQYSKDGKSWYKSGATGNNTDTLSIKVSSTNLSNMYRCKMTGIDGNVVYSDPGVFVIIEEQPAPSTAKIGEYATFSLKVEGATEYQWQYSDDGKKWYRSTATGAQTDTIRFKATSTNHERVYRCRITTETGIYAYTKPVGFAEGVKITSQPVSVSVAIGQKATFTVEATGAVSYQWQYSKDGKTWYKSSAGSSTTKSLSVTKSDSNKSNVYRCKLTSENGSIIYTDTVSIH